MDMQKNGRFLNEARKNATRNHDAKKLDPIQEYLQSKGIPTVREVTEHDERFSTPNKIRIPDLRVTNWDIRLEHDTVKVHGELGFVNDKTVSRIMDYLVSSKPCVILNEDLARHLHLPENELSLYLIYHEKSRLQAIETLRGYGRRHLPI